MKNLKFNFYKRWGVCQKDGLNHILQSVTLDPPKVLFTIAILLEIGLSKPK